MVLRVLLDHLVLLEEVVGLDVMEQRETSGHEEIKVIICEGHYSLAL